MCINRPLYQCEGAVFFSSEMRKVRASVNSDFSEALQTASGIQRYREGDSPLPFPDSGMLLWGIGGSQIYVTQSRSPARIRE